MLDLPRVIGHRGAAGHAPENTPASFRKAAELGCRMVEFDVRLSADGVPVVFHDDTLDRTTAGSGRVKDHPSPALRSLGVATLDEVLGLCLSLGLAVNVEIKPDRGDERRTAIRALETAGRIWPSDRPAPLVSSFCRGSLEAARDAAPAWPRGLLADRLPRGWRRLADGLGCAALHLAHDAVDGAVARKVRAEGLALLAYTVNEPGRAGQLWSWGVDAVFSDFPDHLVAALTHSS